MADLSDTIQSLAESPASVAVDGQIVTEQPIPDVIAADKYAAAKAALTGANAQGGARSGWNRLRPARVIPPGAV